MRNVGKALLAALLAAMLLVSCTTGSYTAIMYDEDSGDSFWDADYENFDGFKQREITISDDDAQRFEVEIVTNSGSLGLRVENSEGTSFYSGNQMPTSSFQFDVSGAGKYLVRFDADDHSGSFHIKWD